MGSRSIFIQPNLIHKLRCTLQAQPVPIHGRPLSPTCMLIRSVSSVVPHTMQLHAGGFGLHVTYQLPLVGGRLVQEGVATRRDAARQDLHGMRPLMMALVVAMAWMMLPAMPLASSSDCSGIP